LISISVQRLTCPRQPRFQAQPPGLVSGQLSPGARRRSRERRPGFPAAFRPPAFASWASCSRRGFRSPHGRPTGSAWTWRGCHVPHIRVTAGLGALFTPGPSVLSRPVLSLRPPLAPSSRGQALSPRSSSHLPGAIHYEASSRFTCVHPPGLPPHLLAPGWNTGPLGLIPGLRTPAGRTCGARRVGDGHRALTRS
jgi:hypothetical protein